MSRPIRLTSAAERDVLIAAGWYVDEAPQVLGDFEEEIDRTLLRIGEHPEMYQVVEAGVRRATVQRFPFSVFYRELSEWVEVVGILHQSRDPRHWRRRV